MDDDFGDWGRMKHVDPDDVDTGPGLAALLPEALARGHNVLPAGRHGRVLTLLIGDPNDFATMDLLRSVLRPCSEVRFALTSTGAIRSGIERVYGDGGPAVVRRRVKISCVFRAVLMILGGWGGVFDAPES